MNCGGRVGHAITDGTKVIHLGHDALVPIPCIDGLRLDGKTETPLPFTKETIFLRITIFVNVAIFLNGGLIHVRNRSAVVFNLGITDEGVGGEVSHACTTLLPLMNQGGADDGHHSPLIYMDTHAVRGDLTVHETHDCASCLYTSIHLFYYHILKCLAMAMGVISHTAGKTADVDILQNIGLSHIQKDASIALSTGGNNIHILHSTSIARMEVKTDGTRVPCTYINGEVL